MKTRHKRLGLILLGLLVFSGVVALVLNAFRNNLVFFYSPTQVYLGEAPKSTTFRIGGLVKKDSLQRQADGVSIAFIITDTEKEISVRYKGGLPDLFREGKGVVAQGKVNDGGVFVASEVLAKHDENYMPPEAQQAVSEAHARALTNQAALDNAAKTLKPPPAQEAPKQ